MSSPPPGPEPGPEQGPAQGPEQSQGRDFGYVPVSPLLDEDPPKIGDFWLDARIGATASGVAFVGHDAQDRSAMVILLSEGAAGDPAARDRLAGEVNRLHIDAVLARGGEGQDSGRLARKFQIEDDPVPPDGRPPAPWVAMAYDGSPAAAAESKRILDQVELADLSAQGRPAGPEYNHYWIDRVRPGLARLWPLPWPGRYDRAGWRTILVSWLLMLLIGALAVLIAILIFRNQPPQAPPPPTGGSGSPPPSASSSPQSGSPQSGSPQSGSPQSGSPQSGSPSGSQSGSPSGSQTGGPSQSPSGSGSGSPSPSGTESGGQPTPSATGDPGNASPGSRL